MKTIRALSGILLIVTLAVPGVCRASVYDKSLGQAMLADCSAPPKTYPMGQAVYFTAYVETCSITQPNDAGAEAGADDYCSVSADAELDKLVLNESATAAEVKGAFKDTGKKCGDRVLFAFSGVLKPSTGYTISLDGDPVVAFKTGTGAPLQPDLGVGEAGTSSDSGSAPMANGDSSGCSVGPTGFADGILHVVLLFGFVMLTRFRPALS